MLGSLCTLYHWVSKHNWFNVKAPEHETSSTDIETDLTPPLDCTSIPDLFALALPRILSKTSKL